MIRSCCDLSWGCRHCTAHFSVLLLIAQSSCLQASSNPRALEDPLKQGDPESSTIGEGLEDNSEAQTQAAIVQHSMQVDMDMVLSTLSTREHGILRMRYGLDDGEPKTLEDIGNAFHVCPSPLIQPLLPKFA